jgi:hypothetical protein
MAELYQDADNDKGGEREGQPGPRVALEGFATARPTKKAYAAQVAPARAVVASDQSWLCRVVPQVRVTAFLPSRTNRQATTG